MNSLKIQDRPLNSLKAYDNNPRFNENAVEAVAESIREFGFLVPVVIDQDSVIAAEQLGRTCYMIELDPGYADVIMKRYEKFTGEPAERIR